MRVRREIRRFAGRGRTPRGRLPGGVRPAGERDPLRPRDPRVAEGAGHRDPGRPPRGRGRRRRSRPRRTGRPHRAARGERGRAGRDPCLGDGPELVVGAGFQFEDKGEHELKGVPGRWRLYALDRSSSGAGFPPAGGCRRCRTARPGSSRAVVLAIALAALLWRVCPGRRLVGRDLRFRDRDDAVHRSGSDDIAYLGEGMVNLLGTKLDGAGDLRSVDSRALLGAINRSAEEELEPEPRRGDGRQLRRRPLRPGKSSRRAIVFGSTPRSTGRTRPRPWRRRAPRERRTTCSRWLTRSPPGSSATWTALGCAGRAIASVTTSSLPALKAYLVGEQAFRVGEYRAAEAFQQAVGQDSLFALAYYRLAAAAEYAAFRSDIATGDGERLRYSDRLSSRDRALVDASLAVRRGDANEAERLLRSYLGRYPDDVQAWFDLGEVLFHLNPLRGRPGTEAREPFGRVIRYRPIARPRCSPDPAGGGRPSNRGDGLPVDRYMAIAGQGSERSRFARSRRSPMASAEREVEVLTALPTAPDVTLLLAVANGCQYSRGTDGWERLVRLMIDPSRAPRSEVRAICGWERPAGRRSLGRGAEELARARGLAAPALETYYRSIVALLPYVPSSDEEIAALLDEARGLPAAPSETSTTVGPSGRRVVRAAMRRVSSRPGWASPTSSARRSSSWSGWKVRRMPRRWGPTSPGRWKATMRFEGATSRERSSDTVGWRCTSPVRSPSRRSSTHRPIPVSSGDGPAGDGRGGGDRLVCYARNLSLRARLSGSLRIYTARRSTRRPVIGSRRSSTTGSS